MTEKTLLTIGEVAKILGITRRMIINYEEKGLMTPDDRGEFKRAIDITSHNPTNPLTEEWQNFYFKTGDLMDINYIIINRSTEHDIC